MHPASGLNFCTMLNHPLGRQMDHLLLVIRPHHRGAWCIHGPHEARIGRYHATARAAHAAIRAYCTMQVTATVRIYWTDGYLWRTDEISAAGVVTQRTLAQRVH